MRPISGVAFCAPRCAYVEYAHSGARRLLGSGPPERQISRPGFRPHLWLAALVCSRSRPYGRPQVQHITPKWKARWNLLDEPRVGGGTAPVAVSWPDRATARATAGCVPRDRRRPGYRQAPCLPDQHRVVEPASLCQLEVESKGDGIMNWTLEVVTVPVTDVERAKHFYSKQVGFVVDHDTRVSDEVHVVQLTPSGSGCSIVVGKGIVDMQPGSLKGLQLVVSDLHKARAHLVERGVEVSQVQVAGPSGFRPSREGDALNNVGFVFFSDPDGNGWAVQQISDRG